MRRLASSRSLLEVGFIMYTRKEFHVIYVIWSIFKKKQQQNRSQCQLQSKTAILAFISWIPQRFVLKKIKLPCVVCTQDKPNDIHVTAPSQVLLTPGTCPPPHSQGNRRASKRLVKSVEGTVAQGVIHKRLQYMWAFRCPCNVFGWSRGLGQQLVCCELRKRWGSGLHLLGLSTALAWVNNPQTRACWGDYQDSWAKANTGNAAKGQQHGERHACVYALFDLMVSMTAGNKWTTCAVPIKAGTSTFVCLFFFLLFF